MGFGLGTPRPRGRLWAPVVSVFVVAACVPLPHGPRLASVAQDATSAAVDARDAATLWISYQIELVAIGGRPWAPVDRTSALYWRLQLDPGQTEVTVRLDYRSPTLNLTSEPVDLVLNLAPKGQYRLLDLGESQSVARRFDPRVIAGGPK